MAGELPMWLGNIHDLLGHQYCGPIVTLGAVVCGAAVGSERQRREKPGGLRTMILVSLGSCIFAQAGLLIAGHTADPGRIAAQVVTGVGFLGAGAIIRERGLVIGITTGAAIWTMAAIGVVMGSGFVVAGIFFTVLTVATLSAVRKVEPFLQGHCHSATIRIEFDAVDGKTRPQIQAILDDHLIADDCTTFTGAPDGTLSLTVRYCDAHRHHRAFLAQLALLPAVRRVSECESAIQRER